MRTFTRSAIEESRALWDAGGFSPEWRDIRHKAAMGGLIYPPSGDAHDSWEDDSPSQRAILIRAIRETPALLERCVIGAPSWSVVIARLTRGRDDWRAELDAKERAAARSRDEERPRYRDSVMSIREIIERVAQS